MGFMGWRRKRKFVPNYRAAWSYSSKLTEWTPALTPPSTGFLLAAQTTS